MLVGILMCLFTSGTILTCSSVLKCHPSFNTSLVTSTNKLWTNAISGLPKLVKFKEVIGDYPILPKIELTADSSVSVAIGVVISKKKGSRSSRIEK